MGYPEKTRGARNSTNSDDDQTPTMATVTQPGTTTTRPPPDLKARIKETYDTIAPLYNQTTLGHRAQRMPYMAKLIDYMRDNVVERFRTPRGSRTPDSDTSGALSDWPGLEGLTDSPITVISLRGMRALEVGCGSGVPIMEVFLAEHLDVVGVDLSTRQLELAREHFPAQTQKGQAVWEDKDMMDVRYPPEVFHAIVGLYSLVHLPREEQTVFLHRAARWLKPGGLLMINLAQEELEGKVTERWLGHEKGWMYWSSWGEEKTVQVIEGLGLKILLRDATVDEDKPTGIKFVWIIARKPADP